MRPRAIKDLSQLPDPDFFASVAEGMSLVVQNAGRLYASAATLNESKHFHGSSVLKYQAEEEASKFLILLDAVRCPRNPSDRFCGQLGRFNNHLAKGLYARAYGARPETLERLQIYLDTFREELYLDGPNGIDWIFRNEICQGREGELYVDYMSTDEGHFWHDPGIAYKVESAEVLQWIIEPKALQVARSLFDIGIAQKDALILVADIWRSVSIKPETPSHEIRELNQQTLKKLDSTGILRKQPAHIYGSIIDDWQFPLYDLDLKLIPVDINTLRERQDSWNPDYY